MICSRELFSALRYPDTGGFRPYSIVCRKTVTIFGNPTSGGPKINSGYNSGSRFNHNCRSVSYILRISQGWYHVTAVLIWNRCSEDCRIFRDFYEFIFIQKSKIFQNLGLSTPYRVTTYIHTYVCLRLDVGVRDILTYTTLPVLTLSFPGLSRLSCTVLG